MPPRTNLESLLFGGGEGKVACESLADGRFEVDDTPSSTSFEAPFIPGVYYPDGYDRKASTKGLANPKSGPVANRRPRERSVSAAAAGGKPPVLALPAAKIQNAGYTRPRARQPARGRIFPKKKGGRKPAVPEAEPGSPKVDCLGKVLSGREQGQCRRGTAKEREVRGCWAGLADALRCWFGACGGREAEEKEVRIVERSLAPSRTFLAETARRPLEEEEEKEEQPASKAMGLGSMRSYTSARRTASWGEEAERVARNSGSCHRT